MKEEDWDIKHESNRRDGEEQQKRQRMKDRIKSVVTYARDEEVVFRGNRQEHGWGTLGQNSNTEIRK